MSEKTNETLKENENRIFHEETGNDQDAADPELLNLLDSTLNDFGKSKMPETVDELASGVGQLNLDPNFGFVDQATAKKAAQDFQSMLSQLSRIQQSVFEQLQANESNSTDDHNSTSETKKSDDSRQSSCHSEPAKQEQDDRFSADDAKNIWQNINSLADCASKVAEAENEEDFMRELKNLEESGDTAQFMPFMTGLMSSFLSKDMMYPPIKDLVQKYPKYLTENEGILDAETLLRYQNQLELMRKVCAEYENEVDPQNIHLSSQQFERITKLMQEMQSYGYPPEELTGGLPPGWSFDNATMMPQLNDPSQAAESCSVM